MHLSGLVHSIHEAHHGRNFKVLAPAFLAYALFLEEDPQEFFLRLGRKAASSLSSGGLFAVEVGYDTAWPARCALDKIKQLKRGHGVHDFSGIERVLWALRK